uniref:CX domain-containing protein n=1 Tax=Steinernema glaseri TaxID=37863 RepID=A0A1I7Y183_9BILA
MLPNFLACVLFALFSSITLALDDATSSSEIQQERTLGDGDRMLRRYCQAKPESPLCGFVVTRDTETVFPPNSNSIIHTRSERDDSESFLPITTEDLEDEQPGHLFSSYGTNEKRKKRYVPYGMMGPYGGMMGGYHPMMGGYHPMMGGMGGYHPMMGGMGGYHPMMGGMGGYGGYHPYGGFGSPLGVHATRGFGVMTPIGHIGGYRSFSLGFGK